LPALLNPYEPSKTAEVLSEQLGLPSVDFDILEVATRSYSSIMARILTVSSMLLGSECHVDDSIILSVENLSVGYEKPLVSNLRFL